MRIDRNPRLPVVARQCDMKMRRCFANIKAGMVMNTGEQSSPRHDIKPRRGIAPRDENTFARPPMFIVPFNGDPVGCIFRTHPHKPRNTARTNLFQSNQANPGDPKSPDQFRPKRRGQKAGKHIRIDAIVGENPAIDQSSNQRQFHEPPRFTTILGPPNPGDLPSSHFHYFFFG